MNTHRESVSTAPSVLAQSYDGFPLSREALVSAGILSADECAAASDFLISLLVARFPDCLAEKAEPECRGHEPDPEIEPGIMGQTVYCDGSCERTVKRRKAAP